MLGKITTAWTNAWNTGVGVSIIEHILHIITNINNTIGALAKNFGNAWDKASIGQKIFEDIDGLADIILGTLMI
ncbi:hypothetical protein [Lacticaseibacillus saniviri]|uniref:hypothetical protein n=1 Tax=Lacticaseibacillus saniviri TaxID=931533 RepID=UPI0006D1C53E|nr:hypothetical protein [Lacticaseibacillus saniviri]